MSNTRRAAAQAPFRQEKFASSAALERGLMANLVAKRCEALDHAADRELVWYLQLLSHAEGGLKKLASDLVKQYPERIATKSMQRFGFKAGQIYNAEKVRAVRDEIESDNLGRNYGGSRWPLKDESSSGPANYPASVFVDACHEAAMELDETLASLCLDPGMVIATFEPWYLPGLIATLREVQSAWIESRRAGAVVTELGTQVYETLDYCLQGRCMVLIDGLARTGKTFSAKAWCDFHPGRARYVQVPSSTDDIGFFRAIARALGVSINQNSKAQQLRDRIEDTVRGGNLALVFDEAHYCWPQSNYRAALPGRINWIMTALVNQNVPVALVTTPQFMRTQKAVENKSTWTSEQFTGRIAHYQKLPDSLSEADLESVARAFVPEGCAKSIETLVKYAQGSAKYLAAIESVARRSRFLASKARRDKVTFADIRSAIKESVIPSDSALAIALAPPAKSGRSRAISAPINDRLRGDLPSIAARGSSEDLAVENPSEAPRAGAVLAAA